jgi:hypothetical protein
LTTGMSSALAVIAHDSNDTTIRTTPVTHTLCALISIPLDT